MKGRIAMHCRIARPEDAARLCDIYAPYVKNTAITFADTPMTREDFLHKIHSPYPVLVCETGGQVMGYAYASRFREKEAYRWCAEISIYVDGAFHGRGAGSLLMEKLLLLLQAQQLQCAFSGITMPNEKSMALHRKFGFREAGRFENAGYKLGKWRDVQWMQLQLCPARENPPEPIPFSALPAGQTAALLK